MREDDDRRLRREAGDIILQPLQLIGAEIAKAARLEIHDIDEADIMHALLVEAVPAGAF